MKAVPLPASKLALTISVVLLSGLMLAVYGRIEQASASRSVLETPTTRLETDIELATQDALEGSAAICGWFTVNQQGRQLWLCPVFPFVTPGPTTTPWEPAPTP